MGVYPRKLGEPLRNLQRWESLGSARRASKESAALGEPRNKLVEPWSQLGGPQSQLGEPQSHLGGPQSQLGGPQSQLGGPRGGTEKKKKKE